MSLNCIYGIYIFYFVLVSLAILTTDLWYGFSSHKVYTHHIGTTGFYSLDFYLYKTCSTPSWTFDKCFGRTYYIEGLLYSQGVKVLGWYLISYCSDWGSFWTSVLRGGFNEVCVIIVDACQVCHKVAAKKSDRYTLAFF